MDDLVKRLRDRGVCSLAHNSCRNDFICEQAADEIERLRERIAELEAALAVATDVARQAVNVIELVQTYEQPDDPWTENALTMREHEVFDFDVDAARAALGEKTND